LVRGVKWYFTGLAFYTQSLLFLINTINYLPELYTSQDASTKMYPHAKIYKVINQVLDQLDLRATSSGSTIY